MRWLLPIALLTVIAGCSEQSMCISRETRDLRQVQSFINEARGNLDRGYALVEEEYIDYERRACGTNEKGQTVYCKEPVVETRRVPKAIDLDAEAAKLATLEKKERELAARAEAAVAACKAAYPE